MPRAKPAAPVPQPPVAPVPLHQLQAAAERRWARTDKVMAALSRAHPLEPWTLTRADPFHALVQAFCHQQVSLAAGKAIGDRVDALLGGPAGVPRPDAVLQVGPDALRAAGLSRQKVAYVTDLATKVLAGEVELARFPLMADEAIVAELTSVKGIGTWTAKMFLLFHLQRPDVWCPEDLGLRQAVAAAYAVPEPDAVRVMEERRAAWSPYNSVAARVLWTSRRSAPPPPAAPAGPSRKPSARRGRAA